MCCRAACWCSRSSMIFCKLVFSLFLLHETNSPAMHLTVRLLWNYGVVCWFRSAVLASCFPGLVLWVAAGQFCEL